MPAVIDALAAAVGRAGVRPAADADAVPAGRPRYVATPASTEDTSALLRVAAQHRLRVLARGAGTRPDWGAPGEGVDLILETQGLHRIVEYARSDLVIRAQAGVRLDAVQQLCGQSGQMLALDPVTPFGVGSGTLGGLVASNASGPYRMRFGTCRDLLIGATVVRADGAVARTGGKVVKNVAGYDLGKLYTGSLGTLGILTETVFRLHPRPVARSVVLLRLADPARACAAAARIRAAQLAVSAIEVYWPDLAGPLTVGVLVEGTGGTADRAAQAAALGGVADETEVLDEVPSWWGRAPWPAGGTAIKLAAALSRLPAVLDGVGRHASGLPVGVSGSLGAGVLYAGLPGVHAAAASVIGLVDALRADLPPERGSVVVLCSPIRAGLDRWGPVSGLDLMRRVKARFDPDRLLSPGRFVGGI
jgi:glycolate oxidase FAD binding subunit